MITLDEARKVVALNEQLSSLRQRLRRVDMRRKDRDGGKDAGEMVFNYLAQDGSYQAEKIILTPVVLGYVRKDLEQRIADVERKLRGMGAEVKP